MSSITNNSCYEYDTLQKDLTPPKKMQFEISFACTPLKIPSQTFKYYGTSSHI